VPTICNKIRLLITNHLYRLLAISANALSTEILWIPTLYLPYPTFGWGCVVQDYDSQIRAQQFTLVADGAILWMSNQHGVTTLLESGLVYFQHLAWANVNANIAALAPVGIYLDVWHLLVSLSSL
jgi:hypothetical protein